MTGRQILRAPFARRTWDELAYLVLGAPLALFGACYVLVCFLLGAGLAITALGVPLWAATVTGSRGLGRARRGLARMLLGEAISAPAASRRGPGLFPWIHAALRDRAGWRAIGYLIAGLPVTLLGLGVVTVTWAWGLIAFTYPLQHALEVNQRTARGDGTGRHGFILGDIVFDTWPGLLVVSAAGAVLILLAPWAVRGVVLLDRLLIRSLLGPDRAQQRITDLERSRAHAVDDAAAMLRRIERDLHDGVQARLVALGMNLTMVGDTLGADASDTIRALLATARDNAKAAIIELRDVVRGIHPPVLDNGLDAAVATLGARNPIPVHVRTEIPDRPSAAIETIAYFCLAELLTNVTKHSDADHASVDITGRDGRLRLRVSDNGRGGAHLDGGTGLRGLADRAGTVDGTLATHSPPGRPTVVTIDLPLHT